MMELLLLAFESIKVFVLMFLMVIGFGFIFSLLFLTALIIKFFRDEKKEK